MPACRYYGRSIRDEENCMPGAGTDKTKDWVERPGPCVILVEPQLGDNIGAAARAMANFGLSRLRLVKPREGWPNRAGLRDGLGRATASSTRRRSTTSVEAAIADLHYRVRHHGARARSGQARGAMPAEAARHCRREGRGGRERRRDVRARAQRARKPRGRARRPHRHAAGQSGLRLAQSRAGGGDRRL